MLIRMLGAMMRYFRRRLRRLSKYLVPGVIAAILVLGFFRPALEKTYQDSLSAPAASTAATYDNGLDGSLAPTASTDSTPTADPEIGAPMTDSPGISSTLSNSVTLVPNAPSVSHSYFGPTQCFQLIGQKLTTVIEPALKTYVAFPTGQPVASQLASLEPYVTANFYSQTSASWLLSTSPRYLTTKVVVNSCTLGQAVNGLQHLFINVDLYSTDDVANFDDNTTYDVSTVANSAQVDDIRSYRPTKSTQGG